MLSQHLLSLLFVASACLLLLDFVLFVLIVVSSFHQGKPAGYGKCGVLHLAASRNIALLLL